MIQIRLKEALAVKAFDLYSGPGSNCAGLTTGAPISWRMYGTTLTAMESTTGFV